MPSWPAIIKYEAGDEVIYISDEDEWNNDALLSGFSYGDGDTLIDATGAVHELPYDTGKKKTQIKDASRKMELAEFSEVVQSHLKAVGQTAVAPKTFAEGLELVEKSLG